MFKFLEEVQYIYAIYASITLSERFPIKKYLEKMFKFIFYRKYQTKSLKLRNFEQIKMDVFNC